MSDHGCPCDLCGFFRYEKNIIEIVPQKEMDQSKIQLQPVTEERKKKEITLV